MNKIVTMICAVFIAAHTVWAADNVFKLKNGDKVVFYGDSITDQRLYTVIAETFVATRYPHLQIDFVNSGWGGDSVSGGGGGPIDTRLQRDIFAYRPTVVTIMLGMNDGGYKAETDANDEKYFSGYKHIVESIRTNLPQARILAIEPSPYDDVTGPPAFPVGGDVQYNEVLRSFGKWIANYATQSGLDVADLNTGVVQALRSRTCSSLVCGPSASCRRAAEGMAGKSGCLCGDTRGFSWHIESGLDSVCRGVA
jgi:lysophospholipase L1-like esterase